MALMVGELYEAAEAGQTCQTTRLGPPPKPLPISSIGSARSKALVAVNTAVLAMNTALVIAVAGRLFQFF